jgi:hypothetical protein
VDQPHAPQPRSPSALPPEVGKEEALVIADDDVLDTPTPVDDDPDLAPQLDGDLREEARELERDDLGRGDLASEDALEGVFLGGLEPDEVA